MYMCSVYVKCDRVYSVYIIPVLSYPLQLLTGSNGCVLDLSAFSYETVRLLLHYVYTAEVILPTQREPAMTELLTIAEL